MAIGSANPQWVAVRRANHIDENHPILAYVIDTHVGNGNGDLSAGEVHQGAQILCDYLAAET